MEWLKMISKDPSCNFLKCTEEDFYSLNDGILMGLFGFECLTKSKLNGKINNQYTFR